MVINVDKNIIAVNSCTNVVLCDKKKPKQSSCEQIMYQKVATLFFTTYVEVK